LEQAEYVVDDTKQPTDISHLVKRK
jgi:hypothetical protein